MNKREEKSDGYPTDFEENTPDKVPKETIIDFLNEENIDLEVENRVLKRNNDVLLDCLKQVEKHLETALSYTKDLDYSLGEVEDSDFGVPEQLRNLREIEKEEQLELNFNKESEGL